MKYISKIKLYSLAAFILALLTLSGCQKYLDINADPSNPQIAEGFALMPPMFAQMAQAEQFDSRYVGKYIQNYGDAAASDTWDRHGYQSGSDNSGQIWRAHYWNLGKNIQLIIDDAQAKQKWDYSGAAKAIMAWSWQTTTDYHGEIILKQAFEPNRYVFDYDSQEDVYKYVQDLCGEALTDLNKTDGGVSQASLARGDLAYKGDRIKWIKFVNAILARNAHHISNKASYNADKVIEYCDKSLASNADNFNVPHTANANSTLANYFGPLRSTLGAFRQSAFVIGLLDGTVMNGAIDPRLPLMFTASPDGVYRGVVTTNGDPNNILNNTKRIPNLWGVLPNLTSTTGKYIFADGADFPIVTYSEIQFIKAEAALKKNNKTLALDAFLKGVSAHLDYANVSAVDKAKYLASKAIPQKADDLTLSTVMLQKYIALYGHGIIETWVDMRRHKYSADVYTSLTLPITTLLFPDNGGKPVYRVRPRYNSEYVWNRASLDKFGGNNPDYHTYEPWFVKP